MPPNTAPEDARETRPRYLYAVFAAALLRPLGIGLNAWRIILYDAKAQCIEQWIPGYDRHPQAEFIAFHRATDRSPAGPSSLLLAHRVITPQAMYWLRRHPPTWRDFLAVFSTTPSGLMHSTLNGIEPRPQEPICMSAHSSTMQGVAGYPAPDLASLSEEPDDPEAPDCDNSWEEPNLESAQNPPQAALINDTSETTSEPGQTERRDDLLEEQFLVWVIAKANRGELKVNDPKGTLHRLAEGLFVLPRLLEVFLNETQSGTREALESGLMTICRENPRGSHRGLHEAYGGAKPPLPGWVLPSGLDGLNPVPPISPHLRLPPRKTSA